MKYLKWMLMAGVFVLVSSFVVTNNEIVSADDDREFEHHETKWDKEDKGIEEIGQLVGWGSIFVIGAAGLIFPMRRLTKTVMNNFPSMKQFYFSSTKFLGKYHIYIGIIALLLSIGHGLLMYLSEGELEIEGLVGLGAVILMIVAGIVGGILYKNKKMKNLRFAHKVLMAFTIIVGVLHVLIS